MIKDVKKKLKRGQFLIIKGASTRQRGDQNLARY